MKMEGGRARTPLRAVMAKHDTLAAARRGLRALPLREGFQVSPRGDVAAVQAAVSAGAKAVDGLGKLIAAHVIARPHADLLALLPK